MAKKREIELDILRSLALLTVIAIHAGGGSWNSYPIGSAYGIAMNIFYAASTWCVPVFVMISGRFFLDPEKKTDINWLFRKHIAKIAIAFLFWSAVYQIYYVVSSVYSLNWRGVAAEFLIGPYHMWFLYMIAGLYLITPFLRKFIASCKLMQYFLLLFLLFSFLNEYAVDLPGVGSIVAQILGKANITFVIGFSGYYLLGYYIQSQKLSHRIEILIYIVGICSLIFTCVCSTLSNLHGFSESEYFQKYLKPNVILTSAAIFTFFVKRIGKMHFSSQVYQVVAKAAELSFGIYLIHALVNEFASKISLPEALEVPFFAHPFFTLLVYFVSAVLVWIIRSMPCVGKWIT